MAQNATERKEELRMALTKAQVREKLSECGTPAERLAEAVDWVMSGHIDSLTALREKIEEYKTDAEKLPNVQRELDELKQKGDPDWQQKYETEHTAFEDYKTKVAEKEEREKKVALYKKLLKDCNVGERQIDNIVRVSGDAIDKLVMKDGKLDGEEAIKENIKTDWSGFIMNEETKGADVDKPPKNEGGKGQEESRAAKIAAEYHKNLYGETKGE